MLCWGILRWGIYFARQSAPHWPETSRGGCARPLHRRGDPNSEVNAEQTFTTTIVSATSGEHMMSAVDVGPQLKIGKAAILRIVRRPLHRRISATGLTNTRARATDGITHSSLWYKAWRWAECQKLAMPWRRNREKNVAAFQDFKWRFFMSRKKTTRGSSSSAEPKQTGSSTSASAPVRKRYSIACAGAGLRARGGFANFRSETFA